MPSYDFVAAMTQYMNDDLTNAFSEQGYSVTIDSASCAITGTVFYQSDEDELAYIKQYFEENGTDSLEKLAAMALKLRSDILNGAYFITLDDYHPSSFGSNQFGMKKNFGTQRTNGNRYSIPKDTYAFYKNHFSRNATGRASGLIHEAVHTYDHIGELDELGNEISHPKLILTK